MKAKTTFFSMALLIAFLLLGCSSDDGNASSSSLIPEAPSGAKVQYVSPGSTLSDLNVQGLNIKWYSKRGESNTEIYEFNGLEENNLAAMLVMPFETEIIHSHTYYATQTVNNVQSLSFLPVTVYCYQK